MDVLVVPLLTCPVHHAGLDPGLAEAGYVPHEDPDVEPVAHADGALVAETLTLVV